MQRIRQLRCRWGTLALAAIGLWVSDGVRSFAAETTTPTGMSRTSVTLTLDSNEPLEIQPRIQQRPAAIAIEFPSRRVIGSLPERSLVQRGAIRAITTRYDPRPGPQQQRYIASVQIELSAPFSSRVRSEPGRIRVEIDHPASVSSDTVEIGLRGGTIIGRLGRPQVSERFRAMQEALQQAVVTHVTWTETESGRPVESSALDRQPATGDVRSSGNMNGAGVAPRPGRTAGEEGLPGWTFWLVGCGVLAVAAAVGWRARSRSWGGTRTLVPSADGGGRLPSGIELIDHLVWQAFERQGYQVVKAVELARPRGILRVIARDGSKAALLLVWNGVFFEKRTVEQFAAAMRELSVAHGFLVASGAFTVPAQRLASQRQIALIGRDQVMGLLSASAASEHFTKQLEQAHARLEEAKETLHHYANELDTLRRQRNEASWYLGEERATSAKLEVQLTDVTEQLRHHQVELERWQQEAMRLRRQWEENEWYLGESQARIRHLETQVSALQEATARVEPAERERDEANWYLAEERTKREALEGQFEELRDALAVSATREHGLQDALDRLRTELEAIRLKGERRVGIRRPVAQVFVEIRNGRGRLGRPLYSGIPRDLSRLGLGLTTEEPLPSKRTLRVRLDLPGLEALVESMARLVWQRAEGDPVRYQSGCQLLTLSDEARERIRQILEPTDSPEAVS